jgi:hypothetical protein
MSAKALMDSGPLGCGRKKPWSGRSDPTQELPRCGRTDVPEGGTRLVRRPVACTPERRIEYPLTCANGYYRACSPNPTLSLALTSVPILPNPAYHA